LLWEAVALLINFGGLPASPPGRCVFEWSLDRQFLVQRMEAPNPAPDAMSVIAVDPETGGYTQHYYAGFDVVGSQGWSRVEVPGGLVKNPENQYVRTLTSTPSPLSQ
jgi:hypothetical protein